MLLGMAAFWGILTPDSRANRAGAYIMNSNSAEYYRTRERAERAAAKQAACPEARRAHQELAQAYAQLAVDGGTHSVSSARSR
jgi:hypothetical protein